MNKFALFVFAAVLLACAVSGSKVGAKMTMNQNALNRLKEQLLPVAEKAAMTASIPDMQDRVKAPVIGRIDVTIKNIQITSLSVKTSSITFASNNQLVVTLSGVDIGVHIGWHYREVSWPHVHDSGKGSAHTSNAGGDVIIALGVDNKGHPTAQIVQGYLSLGSLSITIKGGRSWLYQVIVDHFHGKIVSAIQNGLNGALTGQIQNQLNKLLAGIPTQHTLGDHLAIDYSIGRIAVQNNLLTAGIAGEFFPKGSHSGNAPGQPVSMPDTFVNKMVQIFLSSFSAESLGYAIYKSALGSKTITKELVPEMARQFFSTDFYAQYAPGIIKRFGSGVDVQLKLGLHQTPRVFFRQGKKVEIQAGLELTVSCKEASTKQFRDAFTALIDTDIHGEVKVSNTVISGTLFDATSIKATLVQTQVGNVDVNGINDLVQFALSISQDYINQILAKGTPLPSMPGMKFLNPSVIYQDDYIIIATDMSFNIPTLDEE